MTGDPEDRGDTADTVARGFSELPFVDRLGIEILEARDGTARGRLALHEWMSSNPGSAVAHGGVTYSLADTVAGAAVVSSNLAVTPTIDMRIDYLEPARTDLTATAEGVCDGDAVATADVDVRDTRGGLVATTRGTFKTGGGTDASSAWVENCDVVGPEEVSRGKTADR